MIMQAKQKGQLVNKTCYCVKLTNFSSLDEMKVRQGHGNCPKLWDMISFKIQTAAMHKPPNRESIFDILKDITLKLDCFANF